MKKITKIFVLAIASMVALASCQKVNDVEATFQPKVLKAVFEDELSKTVLSENFQIQWSDSDKITGFDLDCKNYTSTETSVSEDKLEATFTFGSVSLEDDIVYAMYPADAAATMTSGGVITTTLPLVQNAVAGSFDPKANLALASGGEENVKFLNAGGLLAFEIKDDNITKIEIEAGSYENFAGPARLSFDSNKEPLLQSTYESDLHKVTLQGAFENGKTYYAVVFPAEYSSLKMVFTRNDGKTATFTNSKTLTVLRNGVVTVWKNAIDDSKWQGGSDVFDATMEVGTAASEAKVNDKYAIKVGTGSNSGDMTITVGAGATSLSFYAAAWKDAGNTALTITPAENVLSSMVTIKENSGITGSSPFTLAGNEDDYKVVLLLKNISAETTFTLSATPRFVVWGATYSTGELPKYTVTVADGIVGGTVTASPVEAEEGSEITLTATPAEGYNFSSWNVTNASTSAAITVTDNKFTMPAANVNVSATFTKKGSDVTYMLADMDGFSDWGTSYSKRTTTFSDGAYVELASANHSSSTITDCPVSKGGDMIFKAPEGNTITTLKFTCVQWGTKAQTITLNTSTDGETYTKTSVTSENFVLSASNLEDVVAVKFTFSSTSNQIGYESIKVVYGGATLTDVVVSGDATKKSYKAGDKFETAGLVATAKYDDGSTKDVTANATWAVNPETLTAGTTSVSVQATYKEVTSEAFTVSGLTVTEPAVLSSISVKAAPTKVSYTVGDKFDPTGLVITRHYSDGTSDDYAYAGHTSDFSFSPALTTALAETDTKVTITYKEKTVDQAITVTLPTFASLADLVAADLTSGTIVKVTFENVPIKSIYVNGQSKRQGVYFDIQKGGHDIEIYYTSEDVPESWAVEGTLSGTMICPWTYYERGTTWELAPVANSWSWNNLTYTAPLEPCATPEITISNTGSATITCATVGAAIYYTLGTSPADPTSASTRYTGAVTMTDGQTIKAIAYKDGMKASEVTSKKYTTAQKLTYSFTIQTSDFNTSSYAANNGSHDFTATCTTDKTKTMTVSCTSNQIMQSSNVMQWQKSNGYIYNTTDLGTIKSVTVNSSAGTFTTNYGTSEHPTSGTTVGNGFFTVKVGSATGKTSSIVVTFEK